MPTKPIRNVWTFRSDSNPNVTYETLSYQDGTTSCDCKGWTRRVARNGQRSCKHTRWVDQGQADYHCVSSHHYGTDSPVLGYLERDQVPPRRPKPIDRAPIISKPGQRRMIL